MQSIVLNKTNATLKYVIATASIQGTVNTHVQKLITVVTKFVMTLYNSFLPLAIKWLRDYVYYCLSLPVVIMWLAAAKKSVYVYRSQWHSSWIALLKLNHDMHIVSFLQFIHNVFWGMCTYMLRTKVSQPNHYRASREWICAPTGFSYNFIICKNKTFLGGQGCQKQFRV